MKQGRDLERFVEYLEHALLGKDDVAITSPEKLIDRTINKARQFDVVIRIKKRHHESLIAVECRDRI